MNPPAESLEIMLSRAGSFWVGFFLEGSQGLLTTRTRSTRSNISRTLSAQKSSSGDGPKIH
jgi:hypothetical protein